MKKKTMFRRCKSDVQFFALMLIGLCGMLSQPSIAQAAATCNTAATGSISGTVTDSAGAPAVGVQVSAFSPGGGSGTATTDGTGHYVLNSLNAGSYHVQVTGGFGPMGSIALPNGDAGGFAVTGGGFVTTNLANAGTFVVMAGATTSPVNMQLIQGGSISGTVTDSAGAPAVGVQVSAFSLGGGSGTATTDGTGHYVLNSLSAGSYHVQVTGGFGPMGSIALPNGDAGGFAVTGGGFVTTNLANAGTFVVMAGATTSPVNMQLIQGGSISGTVIDSAGAPAVGATVSALSPGGGYGTATTDGTGHYILNSLNAGSYHVQVSGGFDPMGSSIALPNGDAGGWAVTGGGFVTTNFANAGTFVVTGGATTSPVNMQLIQGGSISGTVIDSAGAPAVGATVSAFSLGGGDGTATTDGTGHYILNGLSAGSYHVQVSICSLGDVGGYAVTGGGSVTTNLANAGTFVVTGGATTSPVNMQLLVRGPDTTAPVITLTGANPLAVPQGSTFTDPGSTVTDNVDTGLTATVTGTVNTAIPGAYILTYNVSDAAGNAAATVTRTVNVTVNATVGLSLNGSVFNSTTNNVMTLTETTVASTPATNADVYVALQLPGGTLLVMQANGGFSTAITPRLRNSPVASATVPRFSYTFTGAEPVGTYTWFAALTRPGTLNVIGTLAVAPFSFAP